MGTRLTRFAPRFVTPAHGRLDLSAVVFDQRRAMIDELRAAGVEADAVVVACDENLELARERGFETVERANDWLGARFNDGYESAGLDGATHFVPIGSDSWLDPAFFDFADPELVGVSTGRRYALVDEDGLRLARLAAGHFGRGWGVGPHVVPTALLDPPFRPVAEDIRSGCDGSLLDALTRARPGLPFRFLETSRSPELQYVRLSTRGQQLNPYRSLVARSAGAEVETPWEDLRAVYPAELVAAAEALYARRREEP